MTTFELLFNVLFVMSDVYVAVSAALQVKTHHDVVQKYAFNFSSFNSFTKHDSEKENIKKIQICLTTVGSTKVKTFFINKQHKPTVLLFSHVPQRCRKKTILEYNK